MQPLQPPDSRHLEASKAWYNHRDFVKANAVLENITPQNRTHPSVLEMRWIIYQTLGQWDVCLDLAEAMVKAEPDKPYTWIDRSVSLHELKRTQEAAEKLEPAADLFPSDWLIRHNLACYAIALGKRSEAREWLRGALKLDRDKAMFAALEDQDLQPLLKEIMRG